MTYLKQKFGQNLRLLRKTKGLTQEQLAEQINLNQRQLTRIENGASFVSSTVLEKLVVALNVEIKDLFDFKLKETTSNKNKLFEDFLNKVKKISDNEQQLNYINLAFESLSNKEAREKLKFLIEGMDLLS